MENYRPDGFSGDIKKDLADALEKAIQLVYDMSITKVQTPWDMIHRWENLVAYARKIENEGK